MRACVEMRAAVVGYLSVSLWALRGSPGLKAHLKLLTVTLLRASAAARPHQCVMSERLHILRR